MVEEADADVALDQLLRQSLVLIEVEIPHVALMDGVHAKSFEGLSSGLESGCVPSHLPCVKPSNTALKAHCSRELTCDAST